MAAAITSPWHRADVDIGTRDDIDRVARAHRFSCDRDDAAARQSPGKAPRG
jgi:hypothetical protein